MTRPRGWFEDDADLLRLVAAALQPAALSREDVAAAGRAAYPWLARRVARDTPDDAVTAHHPRSTCSRPPD